MNLAKKILESNVPLKIKIQGPSMLPLIRPGDYVIIKPIKMEEVKVGDILAYSHNEQEQGSIICHRLIKMTDSLLIVKGDTRIRGYERVLPSLVLGRVILIERNKNCVDLQSKFHKFLSSKIAWISLNLPIYLLIIAYFIEALRAPHLVPKKLINKIRRDRLLSI